MVIDEHPPTTIVDCTFRDGGYYNDWEFEADLVAAYVSGMTRAGIDVLELGFRTAQTGKYLGPTAFTTDEFIDSLQIPAPTVVAVMVNAKEFASSSDAPRLARQLFRPAADSRVDLVRLAAVHSEVDAIASAVAELKDLGYQVAVNLMQVSDRSLAEISRFGAVLRGWGTDVAYIADSFGGLRPSDLPPIIGALVDGFQGPVGCHLHDNMTYALGSTIAAVEAGATWADGTLLGMGRGPGNVRTEYLALELARVGKSSVDVIPLVELVERRMAALQREYGWGSNMYYFLSATYGVHPTYVMEMTRDGRYGAEEVVAALDALRGDGGNQFQAARLTGVTSERQISYGGSFEVSGWCEGRDVLLIGPGPSTRSKRQDIEDYIRRANPLVLSLNAHTLIDADLVDAVAVCHPTRVAMDAAAFGELDQPVFAPQTMLDELGVKIRDVRDVGVAVSPEGFECGETEVSVPRLLVAAYAMALAAVGGASRVLLVGFDGFGADDPRQGEMIEVFEKFKELENAPQVVALTRTSYPVVHSSLYAPS